MKRDLCESDQDGCSFGCRMNICDNRQPCSSLCQCVFVCVLCAFQAYHAVSI